MINEILIGLLGIIGLLLGAELTIRKAKKIANRLGVSSFFIGLTMFSIGTSIPEIALHIITSIDILKGVGSFETLSGLAVGTNVGSNIIQITFITGLVTFFGVLKAKKSFLKFDYMVMLGSIFLLMLFSSNSIISRLEAFILFILYIAYIVYLVKSEKVDKKLISGVNENHNHSHIYKDFITMLIGLTVLLLSANEIAKIANLFSNRYMISGSLLGVLIVGVSTALPELTTSIISLKKKKPELSLGTLVGSNITNPMMALGLGGMISTYSVDKTILFYDLPFWLLISTIILWMMWKTQRLSKEKGIILMLVYVVFVAVRVYLI